MALNFDVCKVGNKSDCSLLYIEDKTIYGTTPDARTDYALFLAGFFYQENADDLRVNIDNILSETVVTWSIPSTSDGYYYFDLLPILIWKSTLSFSVGDICYQNTFYWKALTNNSNLIPTDNEGTDWEKVEDPYLEIENLNELGNPVIEQVTRVDEFSLCRADICYGNVVDDFAKNGCEDCNTANTKTMVKVTGLVQNAYMLVSQTRYVEAHRVALLLQDICNDLTDCGCS